MQHGLPNDGDVVVFSRVPTGSMCQLGEPYKIELSENSCDARHVKRGDVFMHPVKSMDYATWDRVEP